MLVAKESGAIIQPWCTPKAMENHELNRFPTCTQLVEPLYRARISKIIFCGMPRLASKSHRARQLREPNAAQRSTYAEYVGLPNSRLHCARFHRVRILSVVECLGVNPLCSSSASQKRWLDTGQDHMHKHTARY